MNTIKKLATVVLAVVAMLGFQQCNDDTIEPAPLVLVDPTSASNIPGGEVTAELTIEAPNGADFLTVYVSGVEEDQIDLTGEDLSVPLEYDYTVPANAVIGSKIVLSFQVTDKEGYPSAIANFVVTVGDPVITLQGNLATRTLVATSPYLLKGQVFIPNNVTVTIPAGTVIKGDKATKAVLVVQPGGKLIAEGTANNPIVFTSNQSVGERDRGDWGGVVILGNAFVNQTAKPAIEGISPSQNYGSTNAEAATPATNAGENSGILKYVRIEYAGVELTPNNETNSLTMGGVGNGTTVEYVQVSFGGDDGFEWFGGTVNGKHLISLSTWDDDFDTDFGWGGNVQFGLVVRNPFYADQSGSNAFESDNSVNTTDTPQGAVGYTRGVFSNVTVLGPRDFNTGLGAASTSTRSISANYANAIHIRRRTALSIFNSFFSGFPNGLRLDDAVTLDNLVSGGGKHTHNTLFFPGSTQVGTSASSLAAFSTGITPAGLTAGDATPIRDYWVNNDNSVTTASPSWSPVAGTPAGSIEPYTAMGITPSLFFSGFTTAQYPSNPNFAVTTGTLTTAGTANFTTETKLANGNNFTWTAVAYRGAFGATDWTDGWAEFQPLNKNY